jgi:peroxin-1
LFGKVTLSAKDFVEAQEGFVPLSLRDVPLQKSDVEWADIGGAYFSSRISIVGSLIVAVQA